MKKVKKWEFRQACWFYGLSWSASSRSPIKHVRHYWFDFWFDLKDALWHYTIEGVGRKSCKTLNCGTNGKCIEKNNTSLCECSDGSIKRKKCASPVNHQGLKEQGQHKSTKKKPFDELKPNSLNKNRKTESKKKTNKANDLKKSKSEMKNKKTKDHSRKNRPTPSSKSD